MMPCLARSSTTRLPVVLCRFIQQTHRFMKFVVGPEIGCTVALPHVIWFVANFNRALRNPRQANPLQNQGPGAWNWACADAKA